MSQGTVILQCSKGCFCLIVVLPCFYVLSYNKDERCDADLPDWRYLRDNPQPQKR